MSYGDKTRAIVPLLDGTLTAQQIGERVGCDAKTVRGVASKLRLPILFTSKVQYCAGFTRTNQERAEQAAEARQRIFLALYQAISADRPVRMKEVSEQTSIPPATLEKHLLRLRDEGRLQRTRQGRLTLWALLENGKQICRSTTRDLPSAVPQHKRAITQFHAPMMALPPDSDVERAKTSLRKRGDVVWTEDGVHIVNGRFRCDDAGLIERAEHKKRLDAQLRRAA